MATQNILDSGGNIIGTLTLPDGTDPSVFTAALQQYTIAIPVPPNIPDLNVINKSSISSATTSSPTLSVIPGMTVLPPAGTYIASFSGSVNTGGASAAGTFGIYLNGVLIPETNRPISCNITLLGGLVSISVNQIGVGTCTDTEITVDGNSTLDVRFNSTNGGTIGFTERVFRLLQVA